MQKKVAIVVQRYGLEINGGAEYHARLIAKHLSRKHKIEVLTTCALDYVTWSPFYPEGIDIIEGIAVRRFLVDRERDPKRFGDLQKIILNEEHTILMEEEWMREQGPECSSMGEFIAEHQSEFDLFIFFSFRYYTTFKLLPLVAHKAILVPTAEHDDIVYLRLFKQFFQLPAAIAYNSVEERDLIWKIAQNHDVMGLVVGVGSEIPAKADELAFREKYSIPSPYILYVGRLDENKGLPQLFDHFVRYSKDYPNNPVQLVLAGKTIVDIPDHPKMRYIGFVSDEDKFNGLAGAECLVIPSQFESLSMVTLEAWAMSKPVLANGRTEVLKGQCQRSQAGLWFTDYEQFSSALQLLTSHNALRKKMGINGRNYFIQHYSWSVIEAKYEQLIKTVEGLATKKGYPG